MHLRVLFSKVKKGFLFFFFVINVSSIHETPNILECDWSQMRLLFNRYGDGGLAPKMISCSLCDVPIAIDSRTRKGQVKATLFKTMYITDSYKKDIAKFL